MIVDRMIRVDRSRKNATEETLIAVDFFNFRYIACFRGKSVRESPDESIDRR